MRRHIILAVEKLNWRIALTCGIAGTIILIVLVGPILFGSSTWTMEVEMKSSVTSTAQVFYDTGKGFNEEESTRATVKKTDDFEIIQFPLRTSLIKALRFDPLAQEGLAIIRAARLSITNGKAISIPLEDFQSKNGVQEIKVISNELYIKTISEDPILHVTLDSFLVINSEKTGIYMSAGIILSICLYLVVLVFLSYRFIIPGPSNKKEEKAKKTQSTLDTDSVSTVRLRTSYRVLLLGICYIVIYFQSFHLGGMAGLSPELDISWGTVLEYAALKNLQFGHDIIFTFGPLGYLYPVPGGGIGELASQRAVFALFYSGLLAICGTAIALQLRTPLNLLFLIWFTFFGYYHFDITALLLMGYCGLLLIKDHKEHGWCDALIVVVFVFLGLIKFTFLLIACCTLAIVMTVRFIERQTKEATQLFLIFFVCLFLLWVALGQNPANLVDYLLSSMQVASGYNAMSLGAKSAVLKAALVICLTFLLLSLGFIIITKARARSFGILAIVSIQVFLTWKHGFTRADEGHVFIFLFFVPLACCLLITAVNLKSIAREQYILLCSVTLLCMILSVIASFLQSHEIARGLTKRALQNFSISSGLIKKALTDVVDKKQHVLQSVRVNNPDWDLVQIRESVGDSPIDVFNYRQGIAFLNGLNYRPRPVFQSYSTYTNYLLKANYDFYRSERRPPYVLYSVESIDARIPAIDDALVLPYIIHNYTPFLSEKGFMLLQLSRKNPEMPKLEPLLDTSVQFGQGIDISAYNGQPLIIQVTVQETLLGRLVGFVYQPAQILLTLVLESGQSKIYRFIAPMASGGVIMNPLIENNTDLADLWSGANEKKVRAIVFTIQDNAKRLFSGKVGLKLYRSPNLAEFRVTDGKTVAGSLKDTTK